MFNLLNLASYEWVASIVACLAVAITITFFIISNYRENKNRIVEKFGNIYKETFALREKISEQYCSQLGDEEFFYEIDNVLDNKDIMVEVLDYLTNMEDLLFLVMTPRGLHKTFVKLSSFALYTRMLSFYGIIVMLRKTHNSPNMFENYCTVVNRLAEVQKIKRNISNKDTKYYLGIRKSDSECKDIAYFKDSIAMFADQSADYGVRPNQNIRNKDFFPFVEKNIDRIIATDSNAKFMCYNGNIAYGLPKDKLERFICLNDQHLINFLNDKISCKQWLLDNTVPVIGFETFEGSDILDWKTQDVFSDTKQWVVQSISGGGGIGTYVLTEHNFDDIKSHIIPNKKYLRTPYIQNNISVNTHVFIAEKQTILSPGSIQIVELKNNQLSYRGADFIAFRHIDKDIKTKIKKLSLKIANLLRSKNYRGVAGLDFIITSDGKVFCAEINPRFQASSVLLNMYLNEHRKSNETLAGNIYELNEQSFNNLIKTDLHFDDEINYSCYYYYNDYLSEKYFEQKYKLFDSQKVIAHLDGLKFGKQIKYDDNSYMFRAIFPHAICTISPEYQLWLNDNIVIRRKPETLLALKIALLNQGVRLLNADKNIKTGVYESVDIAFSGEQYTTTPIKINCAYDVNLSQYSPFALNCADKQLYYYDIPLGDFEIEHDVLSDFSETDRKILYIATDRLRIKLISGCEFKNYGRGCAFCNVPLSEYRFDVTEIKSALERLKDKKIDFRHILIGGGTYLENDVWDKITKLAQALKQDDVFKDKPISLMTVLPPVDKLQELKSNGIDEVAFNMEIADESLAATYMPGKHRNKEDFYSVMNKAVEIFGVGNVRSALIIGLDKEETLINEVKKMAENGIVPCLSALRALPKAKLNIELHPTNEYLCEAYLKCVKAISNTKPISQLGPLCSECKNNMVAL